jgi:tetraacyldisaccharide 4'-kinase
MIIPNAVGSFVLPIISEMSVKKQFKQISHGMNILYKYFKKIIDGSEKGILAAVIRFLLFLLSLLYAQLAKIRSTLYQNNILKKKEAEVPVISIGNITTGGTGKTPFTAFLAEELKSQYKIAIISRGYGAAKDVEEPFLIKDS